VLSTGVHPETALLVAREACSVAELVLNAPDGDRGRTTGQFHARSLGDDAVSVQQPGRVRRCGGEDRQYRRYVLGPYRGAQPHHGR